MAEVVTPDKMQSMAAGFKKKMEKNKKVKEIDLSSKSYSKIKYDDGTAKNIRHKRSDQIKANKESEKQKAESKKKFRKYPDPKFRFSGY